MLDINQKRAVSVILISGKYCGRLSKALLRSRITKIAKNPNTRGGYHLPNEIFVNECKSSLFKMFLR